MTQLLEVDRLSVSFKTDNGVIDAVREVSFDLGEDEILGIVGESGSGKSVTAMSIPRLLASPPAFNKGGRVRFDGRDLGGLSREQLRRTRGAEIGVIFQDPMTSLNPVRRIGVQLTEGLQLHRGLSRSEAKRRAVDLLEQVGIPSPAAQLKSYPHQLSGGMGQRVMIAIALSCEPRLLIADEPTTALDVTVQAQLIDLVLRLSKERGMAVVWITHDLALLPGLADRTLVMYGGRVMEEAPTGELFRNPQHPYTLRLLDSIVDEQTPRGVPLRSIRGTPPMRGETIVGCPFAPRCDHARQECREEHPEDSEIGPAHRAACWVMPNRERHSVI